MVGRPLTTPVFAHNLPNKQSDETHGILQACRCVHCTLHDLLHDVTKARISEELCASEFVAAWMRHERASVFVLYVLEHHPSSSLKRILLKATPKTLGALVSMLHIESY